MTNAAEQIARILYKEIVPGDLRKINAESNDANTGAGPEIFASAHIQTFPPSYSRCFQTKSRRTGAEIVSLYPPRSTQGLFTGWTTLAGHSARPLTLNHLQMPDRQRDELLEFMSNHAWRLI